jgi:putative membrane protein
MLLTWRYQLLVLAIGAVGTSVYLEYLTPHFKTPATVVSILGISLSFFIGFLNSHAYERWMQARTGFGAVQRGCRDFGRMVLAFISSQGSGNGDREARALQKRLIYRQLAVIRATKARLQNDRPEGYLGYLDNDDVTGIEGMSHVPLAILLLQARTLHEAVRSNHLDNRQMIAINGALNDTTAAIGTCDRIHGTPFFPFYLTIVRYAVWAFLILFPMAIADAVGYWAVFYTFLLGVILTWLVESAYGLMHPFEPGQNAVALENITRQTEIDLLQQLGEQKVPSPVAPVDNVYLP